MLIKVENKGVYAPYLKYKKIIKIRVNQMIASNIDYRICSIIYMTTPTPTNHFSIVK